ncbi:ion transporter [Loktanella sp. D2R18]|uniref:ion transporter n=1 Tax=Rhodobacterales TaxID=204455 RepID=UPI000DEB21BA|nr:MULTISPECIES: ion transporter [Rhodobacterales]MDO6590530.1 ion transporter [Yoonia sp. 1_MG-2023]RBW41247.1 ion transporter [Loktanella sp. D2R18]
MEHIGTLRTRLSDRLETPAISGLIIGVILFNALILGLETLPGAVALAGPVVSLLDTACRVFFVAEISIKLFATGGRFFRGGWNLFDLSIVVVSLLPATESFAVLRALRILRVLRLISVAPRMRRVVEGFVSALPGMGSVFVLMAIIFYIAAVMASKIFGTAFPEWFGSLSLSAYTLFQIMTLESWSMGIVRPVMEVFPYAWVFFVPFIVITTFAVVNLLVGLIVNSMQEAHSEESNAATDEYRLEIITRLKAIEDALAEKP